MKIAVVGSRNTMVSDINRYIPECDEIVSGGASGADTCAEEYAKLQNNAESAAGRGYIDTIIAPEETRKYVIGAFEMLFTKKEERPVKKHGTV